MWNQVLAQSLTGSGILGKSYSHSLEKGATTQDEMVGWHCQLDGHELEQAPGDSGGQESLAC